MGRGPCGTGRRRSSPSRPRRTLDVACGTGFLSRHLPGELTCLDQSARMLEIAAERVPHATTVQADAIPLPFPDESFERLFTGHFYGHLEEADRVAFLAEARRVADELVVVDSSQAHSPVAGGVAAARAQRRLRAGRSTSASSRAPGSLRSSAAAARSCTRGAGSWSFARPRDAPAELVPLARLAPARPPGVPGLRRGRLPARVVAGDRRALRPTRVPVRPGARRRRGPRAPAHGAAARAARSDAGSSSTRTTFYRDLLLRLGDALLSGQGGLRPRGPDADDARAGALRVLATLGAGAPPPAPGRHRRRARRSPPAGADERQRVRRQELHARRRDRDPAPPPVGCERLAQRPGEPRAARARR